jgi:hypothetical protein
MSTYRDNAAPLIACVLAATKGQPEKDIKAALKAAYPFGMRQYHPYQIWCDEIRRQRGLKPKLGTFGKRRKEKARAIVDAGQRGLFEEASS